MPHFLIALAQRSPDHTPIYITHIKKSHEEAPEPARGFAFQSLSFPCLPLFYSLVIARTRGRRSRGILVEKYSLIRTRSRGRARLFDLSLRRRWRLTLFPRRYRKVYVYRSITRERESCIYNRVAAKLRPLKYLTDDELFKFSRNEISFECSNYIYKCVVLLRALG